MQPLSCSAALPCTSNALHTLHSTHLVSLSFQMPRLKLPKALSKFLLHPHLQNKSTYVPWLLSFCTWLKSPQLLSKINTLLVHWNPTVFTVSSLYFPLTLVFPFLNAISIEMYCNFSHLKNVFWILFSPPNNMFIKQHDSLSLFKAEPCKRKIASSCFRVPFSSFDSHHPPYSTMPTKPLL